MLKLIAGGIYTVILVSLLFTMLLVGMSLCSDGIVNYMHDDLLDREYFECVYLTVEKEKVSLGCTRYK